MGNLGAVITGHPLALVAIAIGYALLVFEMYVPGFGAPGILGAAVSIIGLIAMEPSGVQALVLVAAFAVLVLIAFVICVHTAAKGRFSKSRFVLNAVSTPEQTDAGAALRALVGQTGKSATPLRPAGIAEFEGGKQNVVSEGEFIEANRPVRVERVEGRRVIVSELGRVDVQKKA